MRRINSHIGWLWLLAGLLLTARAAEMPRRAPTGTGWRYTTSSPEPGWTSYGYRDSGWTAGRLAFGSAGNSGFGSPTPWSGQQGLWLRYAWNNPTPDAYVPLGVRVVQYGSLRVSIDGQEVASTPRLYGQRLIGLSEELSEDLREGKHAIGLEIGPSLQGNDAHRVAGAELVELEVEQPLVRLRHPVVDGSLRLSGDGMHFALVTTLEDGGYQMLHDGVPSGPQPLRLDQIASGMPVFSAKGNHVAYAARVGSKVMLVVDGVKRLEAPVDDEGWPMGDFQFSPGGESWAVWMRTPAGTVYVVNGTRLGPFPDFERPDGAPLPGVDDFIFDATGQRFAFRARTGEGMRVILGTCGKGGVESRQGPEHPMVGRGTPLWVGEGAGDVAYIAVEEHGERMMGPGGAGPLFDRIARESIVARPGTHPDAPGFAYAGEKTGTWHVVVGKTPGPGYYDVGRIRFSPDGARWACAVNDGQGIRMVVDGETGPRYNGVHFGNLAFWRPDDESPWRVVMFGVRDLGEESMTEVVEDGEVRARVTALDRNSMQVGGNALYYVADDGKGSRVYRNHEPAGKRYDLIDNLRLDNGGKPRYRARRDGNAYLVFNDRETSPLDSPHPLLPFGGATTPLVVVRHQGGWRMEWGGRELCRFSDFVSPPANNGRPVFAVSDDARGGHVLMDNGVPGRVYDRIWLHPRRPTKIEKGRCEFLAQRGDTIYRVTRFITE